MLTRVLIFTIMARCRPRKESRASLLGINVKNCPDWLTTDGQSDVDVVLVFVCFLFCFCFVLSAAVSRSVVVCVIDRQTAPRISQGSAPPPSTSSGPAHNNSRSNHGRPCLSVAFNRPLLLLHLLLHLRQAADQIGTRPRWKTR